MRRDAVVFDDLLYFGLLALHLQLVDRVQQLILPRYCFVALLQFDPTGVFVHLVVLDYDFDVVLQLL